MEKPIHLFRFMERGLPLLDLFANSQLKYVSFGASGVGAEVRPLLRADISASVSMKLLIFATDRPFYLWKGTLRTS